ncbi:MAG: glycogen debranching enzyme, partial [Leptolyngbya sp. SIO1D8]|nr:glycogen debranching enzyme [Leptolyngbya sp. SIO1D8]
VRRTQDGNNNVYCQDNTTSWFDWELVEKEKDLLSFTKKLIKFNLTHKFFQEHHHWNGLEDYQASRVFWHGVKAFEPDWSDHSHALAFTLFNRYYPDCLHIMINAYWEPMDFEIPVVDGFEGKKWYRLIDTAKPFPEDFPDLEEMPEISGSKYHVAARSVVVLKQVRKLKKEVSRKKAAKS